jgi:fimbrial isopeptide formation D2 family protein
MTTHTSKAGLGSHPHTGASFFRKAASLGVAACVLGGSLLATPVAQAADIGWTPVPTKSVVGSPSEQGPNGHDLISNLGVWPGQKVEYTIGVDLNVAPGAPAVTSLSVQDQLPAGFDVDQASIRVVGDNTLTLAASRDYKTAVKDGVLTLDFTDAWIAAHVGPGAAAPQTGLAVSFTVTVSEDAKPYSAQDNVATQIVNGESFKTPAATILIPGVDPLETVAGDDSKPVGDRVAVGGDRLHYSVKLDGTFGQDVPGKNGADATATPLELAYDVSKFGIVDDFDEDSLDINAYDVRVVDSKGTDRTDLFDIRSKGGVLTVLAKADGDRGQVPAVVLGQDYRVEYTARVRDVAKTINIVGTTVEVVDDRIHPVAAESSVKVQAVAPSKSAVIPGVAGVPGVDGTIPADGSPGTPPVAPIEAIPEKALTSVVEDGEFVYKLGSSQLPANRLSPVEFWGLVDSYTGGDRALHDAWSVVADADIHGADGAVLFAKGSLLADQDNTTHFAASFDGDTVSVKATKAFLEIVTDDSASALSWSVYVKAIRTADAGTRVSNTVHEWSNGFDRSASATTDTDPAPQPEPTAPATEQPTQEPTAPATNQPTAPATEQPTQEPTAPATNQPTREPTAPATNQPTAPATEQPTAPATEQPTAPATNQPTAPATNQPTAPATNQPTAPATNQPTAPAEAKGALSIESYVSADGLEKGDHDTAKDAYILKVPEVVTENGAPVSTESSTATHESVKVTFKITNTGKTALENVQLAINPQEKSTGTIGDLSCSTGEGEDATKGLDTLAAGQTATCEGILTGVEPGTSYADIASASAALVSSDKSLAAVTAKATDEMHASLAAADSPTVTTQGITPVFSADKRGAVTGEGVATTNPALVGGGIAALLASLSAAAALMVRRARGGLSVKE